MPFLESHFNDGWVPKGCLLVRCVGSGDGNFSRIGVCSDNPAHWPQPSFERDHFRRLEAAKAMEKIENTTITLM
jgi:hypothetical protein